MNEVIEVVNREFTDTERAEIAEREERAAYGLKLRLSDLQRVIDKLESEKRDLIRVGEKYVSSGDKEVEALNSVVTQYNLVVGKLLFCESVRAKILAENIDESREVNLARADR